MVKEFDTKKIEAYEKNKDKIKRGKYGKSSEKALSFPELDYLRYNLDEIKERIILIGNAYTGMRIEEFIQCRKEWIRFDILEHDGKKLRVLAIDIPEEDKNITNLYSTWRPKTRNARTTYIIDELLAQEFYNYYKLHPKGISEEFKSKKVKSIARNISTYIIGEKFLKLLWDYHKKEEPDISQDKLKKLRPKLSAHPLRSTFENLLYFRYDVSLDIAADILGHSIEIAQEHYIAKTQGNIKHKLAMKVIK